MEVINELELPTTSHQHNPATAATPLPPSNTVELSLCATAHIYQTLSLTNAYYPHLKTFYFIH